MKPVERLSYKMFKASYVVIKIHFIDEEPCFSSPEFSLVAFQELCLAPTFEVSPDCARRTSQIWKKLEKHTG